MARDLSRRALLASLSTTAVLGSFGTTTVTLCDSESNARSVAGSD